MPSVGLLNQVSPTPTPGPTADWTRGAGSRGIHARERLYRPGRGRRARAASSASWPGASAQRLHVRGRHGLRQVPRGRGQRDRHAPQGLEPDREGARLPRRPHPPRRLRVPRRALPLRPAVEPVRRDRRPRGLRRTTSPTAQARWSRTSSATAAPSARTATEGWPSFAGWPRDESQTHEGTYWKWIERAWRSGLRIMVNDLVENRALCELYPLQEEQLQRHGERLQAGRGHARAAGLHRRPVRRPGQGLLPARQELGRGAQGHQRGQARRGARDRGVRGAQLRAAATGRPTATRRQDRRRARQALRHRRALDVPRPQVRQRARRHEVRQRRHGRARQHRQQVRDRASSGPPTTATTRTTTTRRPRSGTSRPSSSTRCSARCSRSRCSRASCRCIRPARTATRRASARWAST